MRIIFLDIDGVLNSRQSKIYNIRKNGPPTTLLNREVWCPIACSNFQHILEKLPDVHVVMSTSWRLNNSFEELRDLLEPLGIPRVRIYGMTPRESEKGNQRGHEIQDWLDAHEEVTDFVIIDDDSDMVHLSPRHVHTSFMHGLQYGDVIQVFHLFGEDAVIQQELDDPV
jgi:hypothetical protein